MNTNGRWSSSFLLSLLLLAGLLLLSLGGAAAAPHANRSNDADSMSCDGSLADCMKDEEMLMELEVSRRFLAATTRKPPISYRALRYDNQPGCGVNRGQPFAGNCGLPPASNGYGSHCLLKEFCRMNTFN